jgi:hypothetical protein
MSAPSYSNLVTQIVKRLREDTRLTAVRNENIFEGAATARVMGWPSIMVSLETVEESWRTFGGSTGGQKNADCTVRLLILDRQPDGKAGYIDGLRKVEDIVQTVDNIINKDVGISGVAYKSENELKTFAQGEFDNTPVISAEIELHARMGFTL